MLEERVDDALGPQSTMQRAEVINLHIHLGSSRSAYGLWGGWGGGFGAVSTGGKCKLQMLAISMRRCLKGAEPG